MKEIKPLKELIQQHSSSDSKIFDNSSLVRDLEIADQSALDFMNAYSKRFEVNISHFDFNKYFPSTTEDESTRQTRVDLTFADLIRGIKVGELNDDVISFEDNDPNLPPKFTVKNVILGIIFVIVTSAMLTLIAMYI